MSSINWTEILALVLQSLVPIVVGAIGTLIYNWMKKRGVKQEQLEYLEKGYDLLTRAVISTNQTWVDALKKANGGKLTIEQQAEARAKTVATFNEMVTDGVKLAIEAAYGTIDNWLMVNLESAVGEVKVASK